MRTLVLWSEPDSANLGVRALAEGTGHLVRRAFGDVEIALQGYGPGDAPVGIGSARSHVKRLARRRDDLIDWVRSFDLVVDTRAGDSFADIYGVDRLTTMWLMHEVALRAGVPVVLGPQTVGPFATRRGSLIARRTVRTAAVTMARDARSLKVARSLGARRPVLTTDVVFAIDQPATGPTRDVVLNVSGLLWEDNPHVDHLRYRRTVHDLIAALRADGRTVSLLAHVLDSPNQDNDVPVIRQLGGDLELEAVVPTDLADVRSVLSGASVVIGSRMHACLNALSVGTPVIPLAYSRKFAPLMSEIGWRHGLDLRGEGEVAAPAAALAAQDLRSDAEATRERAAQVIADASQSLTRVLA